MLAGLDRLAGWLAWPAVVAGRFGGWLYPVLALVIVFDVVGRKFFDTGSTKLQDLEWHLHGAALMLAFGFCYLRDAHVRVDLLRERLPDRTKIALELAGVVLFICPYMLLLTDMGVDFAWRAYVRGEGSLGGTGLPLRWIIKAFLPLGFALTMLAALSVGLRCIGLLLGGGRSDAAFPLALDPTQGQETQGDERAGFSRR